MTYEAAPVHALATLDLKEQLCTTRWSVLSPRLPLLGEDQQARPLSGTHPHETAPMMTFGVSLALTHRGGSAALPALKEVVDAWWRDLPRDGSKFESTMEGPSGTVWELRAESINSESTGFWTTEIRALEVERDSPSIVMCLTMHIQSGEQVLKPLFYRVSVPRVLSRLAPLFEVNVRTERGSEQCRLAPHRIDTRQDVEGLLDQLTNSSRAMPIVIVSETQDEELLLPGLDVSLAERLFGLARVVRVGAYQTQQLTNRVGKELSCFHGGVRVYWPGWSFESSPYAHRLFSRLAILEDTAGDLDEARKRLTGKLMAMLARATVGVFQYPPLVTAVIAEAQLRAIKATDGVDYEQECHRLSDQLKEKDAAIAMLEARLARFELAAAEQEEAQVSLEEDSAWSYSVPQALAAARIEFKEHVVLPERIGVDGNVSGGTIYYFIKSLRDVCSQIRSGDLAGQFGDALRTALARNGISSGKFKQGDTGVHSSMPDGTKKECRSRYHLRSGSPTNTESVYWADWGEGNAKRVFVIGKIGVHA